MSEVQRVNEILHAKSRRFWGTVAIAALLALSVAVNVGLWWGAQQRAQQAETSRVSLAEQVQDRCESEGSLLLGDHDLCEQADEIVEDPGAVATPTTVGPTDAQMDAALARYCSTRDCTPGPTQAQVAEALSDLCSKAGIRCRGADGKDSTVPGPPPTEAQMDATLARYCDARNECQGDAGANGLDGSDGRGILSTQCTTGGWITEYTDGFVGSDSAPCRGTNGIDGERGPAGPQGTAKPGTYSCPDGEVMTGFTVAADGAVTLACEDVTPPIINPTP